MNKLVTFGIGSVLSFNAGYVRAASSQTGDMQLGLTHYPPKCSVRLVFTMVWGKTFWQGDE